MIQTCPSPECLEQYLIGALPDALAADVAAHLAACSRCLGTMPTVNAHDTFVETVRVGLHRGAGIDQEINETLVRGLLDLRERAPVTRPDWSELAPAETLRVPGYEILEVLGHGGMGVVYKARQTRPRRLVALKMILAGSQAVADRLARFRAEADVIARLRHPNIVGIYEAGEHDGLPYFTMEYVEGGSLAERLAVSPLEPVRSARLVEALAHAVHAAHRQGVVHRDLKPANVLLQWDGGGGAMGEETPGNPSPTLRPSSFQPKITDFGLAKYLAEEATLAQGQYRTQSGALLGTPSYMAPEQASGKNEDVGPAADVYALGAILYEALTGRPPFHAASLLETLEQVRSSEPVPPSRLQPGTPRDLQTICLKCLAKEPGKRYASAEELAFDLGRFLRREPILARPVSRLERTIKWAKRRPALAVLFAVTTLAGLGLITGGVVYNALLEDALRQSKVNEDDARAQERRAVENYRAARGALNQMLARLDNKRLAEVPRLAELRQGLLEDALAFYQAALQQLENPDPGIRLDAATAYEHTAAIQTSLGQARQATKNFRHAIDLLEGLPAEMRDAPEALARLAHCYTHIGALEGDAGKFDVMELNYVKALALREKAVAIRPSDAAWQNELARSYHNLGTVRQLAQRHVEAEADYSRAAALREALVRDHPHVEIYQAELAEVFINLGLIQAGTGRRDDAATSYARADGLLRRLVVEHPEIDVYTLSLVGTLGNWGNLLAETGQIREAFSKYTEGADRADAVLAREPLHVVARVRSHNLHGSRALLHESLSQFADAVKDWDHVVATDRDPARSPHRLSRALAAVRAGDHVGAAKDAKTLEGEPGVAPEQLYALACLYSLAIRPAEMDTARSAEEKATTSGRYAAKAVELLDSLRRARYFDRPDRAALLTREPDLAPLRARPEYQKLQKAAGGNMP